MKYFSIALLIIGVLHATHDHLHKFMHIAGTELIDGQSAGITARDIHEMMGVRNALQTLLHGEKKGGIITKYYSYKGEPIHLIDLIRIFEDLDAQGTSHTHPDYQEALACLHDMIEKIISKSDELLKQHSSFEKKAVIHVIHNWVHKRGRHDSFLLNWGKPDEKELFRKISAQELGEFCTDLKNFLYDLIYSCPKAQDQYKEIVLTEKNVGAKYQEKRAAFDHFFQRQH